MKSKLNIEINLEARRVNSMAFIEVYQALGKLMLYPHSGSRLQLPYWNMLTGARLYGEVGDH